MTVSQDIRTGRHCAFLLHAHLVFVTKFRHRVFMEDLVQHYWRAQNLGLHTISPGPSAALLLML
nr:hypothetical protein [Pseudarthrobacter albicanus]